MSTRTVPDRRATRDLRRWVVPVVVGEGLGFALAAGAGLWTTTTSLDPAAIFLVLVGAGAIEGTALGVGQVVAIRRTDGTVPAARWVGASAAGAALAWALGLLPSTLAWDPTRPATWVLAAPLAVLLLLSIPLLQWLTIRRTHPWAARWIWVSVVAWSLGAALTALPSPLVDAATPPGVIWAVYVLAGLLMAVTVAVVTGVWGRRVFTGRGVRRPAE